jgi:hypothetical protein
LLTILMFCGSEEAQSKSDVVRLQHCGDLTDAGHMLAERFLIGLRVVIRSQVGQAAIRSQRFGDRRETLQQRQLRLKLLFRPVPVRPQFESADADLGPGQEPRRALETLQLNLFCQRPHVDIKACELVRQSQLDQLMDSSAEAKGQGVQVFVHAYSVRAR